MVVFKETSRDIWLVLLVTLMALAANLPEGFAEAYSIERKYLLMALTAIIAVSILRYVRFTLVLTTLILTIGANLPTDLATSFNIEPSIMMFTLMAMVAIAMVNRFLKVMPQQPDKAALRGSVYGARALVKAIANGNVGHVQRLIESGVNVNVTTVTGKTPLMLAAFTGYPDIVHALIKGGANIYARDREGNTAINIAERKGFNRVKELLLTHGEAQARNRMEASINAN